MLALLSSIFLFAEGGFARFYHDYLDFPGFEAWKFLNLGVFVAVLVYLLRKPMSEAFKARREEIRSELVKAEEERQAALSRLKEIEAKLAQLEDERDNILKNAKEEAAAEKKRLVAQTKLDIERLKQQAQSELARLTGQARAELRRFSAEESIRLAEEKLRKQIDAGTDAKLVKASISEIGGLN
jgi:F-type H+-transporting ATPase subunit b